MNPKGYNKTPYNHYVYQKKVENVEFFHLLFCANNMSVASQYEVKIIRLNSLHGNEFGGSSFHGFQLSLDRDG